MSRLTRNGVEISTKNEILEDINQYMVDNVETDLNLASDSPHYKINYGYADGLSKALEIVEGLIDRKFRDTSEGKYLDYCLKETGDDRLKPRPVIIECLVKVSEKITGDSYFYLSNDDDIRFVHQGDLEEGESLYRLESLKNVRTGITSSSQIKAESTKVESVSIKRVIQDGLKYEEDSDAIARVSSKERYRGETTEGAIETEVRRVFGVVDAQVIVNERETTDEHGRPSGAIQVVVYGGADTDIAEAIKRKISSGQVLFGAPYLTRNQEIVRFSRVIDRPINLLCDITRDATYNTSDDEIKRLLREKAGKISQGQNLVCDPFLEGAISDIDGLKGLDITAGYVGTPESEFLNEVDITLLERAKIENIKITKKYDASSSTPVPIDVWVQGEAVVNTGKEKLKTQVERSVLGLNSLFQTGQDVSANEEIWAAVRQVTRFRKLSIQVRRRAKEGEEEAEWTEYVDMKFNEVASIDKDGLNVDI